MYVWRCEEKKWNENDETRIVRKTIWLYIFSPVQYYLFALYRHTYTLYSVQLKTNIQNNEQNVMTRNATEKDPQIYGNHKYTTMELEKNYNAGMHDVVIEQTLSTIYSNVVV